MYALLSIILELMAEHEPQSPLRIVDTNLYPIVDVLPIVVIRGVVFVDRVGLMRELSRTKDGLVGFATLKSLMRPTIVRSHTSDDTTKIADTSTLVSFADERIVVDFEKPAVWVDDCYRPEFTPMQYRLLRYLACNKGEIVNKGNMYRDIWPEKTNSSTQSNILDVTMGKVRRILGKELGNRNYGAIRTIYGVGFVAVNSLSDKTDYRYGILNASLADKAPRSGT